MSINPIKNQSFDNKYKTPQNQSLKFKGIADSMIAVANAVEAGGFVASFTIQDVFGTNLPRAYVAYNRNSDITGKGNPKAAIEVVIREIVTGPSMFAIPMVMISLIKSKFGSANNVPVQSIKNFSETLHHTFDKLPDTQKLLQQNELKQAFYTNVFKKASADSKLKLDKNSIDNFVKKVLELEKLSSMPKKILAKNPAEQKLFTELTELLVDHKKSSMDALDSVYTNIKFGAQEMSLKKFLTQLKDYSGDALKSLSKGLQPEKAGALATESAHEILAKFTNSRSGSRLLTNLSMFAAVALFLSNVPKLYMRNKEYPETEALMGYQTPKKTHWGSKSDSVTADTPKEGSHANT